MLELSPKGLILYCIPMLSANIAMNMNGVPFEVVMVFNIVFGIIVAPWFLTGRIFKDE